MKIRRGFTLLELVIVMAIITIMTVVALTNIQSNKKNKELEAAARAVSAAIREAQNNALAGKQITTDRFPCYFGFSKSSNVTYSINYKDHNLSEKCTDVTSESPFITYSLKNNIEIDNPLGNFYFTIPFAEVCTTAPPCTPMASGYITINLHKKNTSTSDNSNYYTVCVTPTGNVYENANSKTCL